MSKIDLDQIEGSEGLGFPLSNLITTDKTSLVNAINEVRASQISSNDVNEIDKRFNGVSDYSKWVLPLFEYTGTSTNSTNSWVDLDVVANRNNGVGGSHNSLNIVGGDAYTMAIPSVYINAKNNFNYIRPCTFIYGGKKYFGIMSDGAAQVNSVHVRGFANASILKNATSVIIYSTGQTPTIVNSEIANSLAIFTSGGDSKTYGTICTQMNGDSSQWNQAYNYSQIGHLSLSGGTMVNGSSINWLNSAQLTTNGNNRLRLTGNHTILSGFEGQIYFRPNGDGDSSKQVNIDNNAQINTTNHGNSSQWNQSYTGFLTLGSYALLSQVYTQTQALGLFVGLTGVQTIAGTKTFSSSPIVPIATLNSHAVNLGQLITAIASVPTYNTATANTQGLLKLGSDTVQTVVSNTPTTTTSRTYPLQLDVNGRGVVNVPWVDTNTTYAQMTATVLGLGKLFSSTVQTVTANAVTATASRTYGVQLNSSGQLVINVPWTDTNVNTVTNIGVNNTNFTSGNINFIGSNGISISKSGNTVTIIGQGQNPDGFSVGAYTQDNVGGGILDVWEKKTTFFNIIDLGNIINFNIQGEGFTNGAELVLNTGGKSLRYRLNVSVIWLSGNTSSPNIALELPPYHTAIFVYKESIGRYLGRIHRNESQP